MSLTPDFYFPRITDIPVEFFLKNGIEGVALDIDNTLAEDGAPDVPAQVRDWIEEVRQAGIEMVIVSNNRKIRVSPFAKDAGLPFLYEVGKPSTKKRHEVLAILGVRPKAVAMVGDQIFTDILFAKRCGFRSVLLDPIGPDRHNGAWIKRLLERPILKKLKRRTT